MQAHSIRRFLAQKTFLIALSLLLLAGAAAAYEALTSDAGSDASATSDGSAVIDAESVTPAPAPEQPPLDLEPWEVTPANAPAPPAGQVPAWVLSPTPPDELAVVEDPPPPPRLPPEPHETPWTTEAAFNNAQ